MLKPSPVFPAVQQDKRDFFAQKHRALRIKNEQTQYEANKIAFQARQDQRRALARTLDPISLISAHGLAVKKSGAHFTVYEPGNMRDEIARVSISKKVGCWMSCGARKEPIGDNIVLLRHLFDYSYLEAVDALLRHAGISDMRSPALPAKALQAVAVVQYTTEAPKFPVLPEQTDADVEAGRKYLEKRGIDMATILKNERDGAVRYGTVCVSEYRNRSVLFVGVDDDNEVMSAMHRSVTNHFRGDITDSDKAFPCIFMGDLDRIVLVEGGISGLAAQSRARRAGEPIPTVIVTGGGSVTKFLENNVVRELLTQPDLKSITLWFENETLSAKAIKRMALLAKKQGESDAAHEKQIAGIEALGGPVLVTRTRPANLQHKDVADVLIAEVSSMAGSIAALVEITAAQKRDLAPVTRLTTV